MDKETKRMADSNKKYRKEQNQIKGNLIQALTYTLESVQVLEPESIEKIKKSIDENYEKTINEQVTDKKTKQISKEDFMIQFLFNLFLREGIIYSMNEINARPNVAREANKR